MNIETLSDITKIIVETDEKALKPLQSSRQRILTVQKVLESELPLNTISVEFENNTKGGNRGTINA